MIPESELKWRFSRSGGPGGQGVNTTDSRVELLFDVEGSAILRGVYRERALDRLLVFDRGRIAEEGTHEALIRHGGIYRRLFDRQALELTRGLAMV